jgi:hypothetical protein
MNDQPLDEKTSIAPDIGMSYVGTTYVDTWLEGEQPVPFPCCPHCQSRGIVLNADPTRAVGARYRLLHADETCPGFGRPIEDVLLQHARASAWCACLPNTIPHPWDPAGGCSHVAPGGSGLADYTPPAGEPARRTPWGVVTPSASTAVPTPRLTRRRGW